MKARAFVFAMALAGAAHADSKEYGVHSPRGRSVYRDDAELSQAIDTHRRIFVIEATAGAGPEGNLGMVFGWLPKQIHGLEFYAGGGFEINPAIHVSGAVRYLFNIRGYRPYLALGYFYKDLYAIETYSHNAFIEGGYSIKLGPTNHLSLGIGVGRILYTGVRGESPLRTREVDPASLDEQIASIPPYLPMFVARFSRAF